MNQTVDDEWNKTRCQPYVDVVTARLISHDLRDRRQSRHLASVSDALSLIAVKDGDLRVAALTLCSVIQNIQTLQSLYKICEQNIEVSQFLHSTYLLHWRNNEDGSVSNHQPRDCLLIRLFRYRWKKILMLRVTGFCEGNSPMTGEFRAQRSSNAENVSIWWRHHVSTYCDIGISA